MLIVHDPTPSGEARRDTALALFSAHRADLIRDLQRAALRLALTRADLTADNLRAVVPIPPDVRPVAHARPLAGASAALAGLTRPAD